MRILFSASIYIINPNSFLPNVFLRMYLVFVCSLWILLLISDISDPAARVTEFFFFFAPIYRILLRIILYGCCFLCCVLPILFVFCVLNYWIFFILHTLCCRIVRVRRHALSLLFICVSSLVHNDIILCFKYSVAAVGEPFVLYFFLN